MASNNNEKKAKGVYVIEEGKNGESYWAKIGVAFTNRDQSLLVPTFSHRGDAELSHRAWRPESRTARSGGITRRVCQSEILGPAGSV